ncbi:hypothetical protein OO013_18465 [Mangrovivirga sp. M17]|uniref:Asl1-like glycosyl hydrolase catalytic domain-containing protein n=1 Tax=Mangrovivirga halotolerans TaxID=2993936 RepID=A0ABT3RWD2_9BACT|nr:hypothetical protein [Mangrovivirga halotolerans]MCX2745872.1 hypothetical protein [Mangrovivirga halotolerans]
MTKFKCKTIFCILIIIIYTKTTGCTNQTSLPPVKKIEIKPEQIINVTTQGNAFLLFDEQNKRKPETSWKPPYSPKWHYPAELIIDLNNEYKIDSISFYDGSSTGELKINFGKPFEWSEGVKLSTNKYNQWQTTSVEWETRYLQIILSGPEVNINEIVISGTLIKEIGRPEKINSNPLNNSLKQLKNVLGTNSFIDVPHTALDPIYIVREYHQWDWMEGARNKNYQGFPSNLNRFNPTIAGNGWNFDSYYKTLHQKGKIVVPVMVGTTLWMTGEGEKSLENKPTKGDPGNPFDYKEHADHMFQFAARYGSNSVKKDLLKLHSSQEKISGMGVLQYYENWNEPDKWWMSRVQYFTPFEYAALSSADYDGHQGKMGETFGILNADPNSKLVMAGLATFNLEYVKAMKFWCEHNRTDKKFVWDVINFHHYSNNGGTQHGKATKGISPEADSLFYKIKRLSNFRDKYLPGKELWITEFGYDTQTKGSQIAPALGNLTSEEVQAAWLIRSIIIGKAAGANRMTQFMLRDGNEESFQTYMNSGLTSSKHTGYQKKTSWYYYSTINHHLREFIIEDLKVDSTTNLHKIKLYNPNNGKEAYIIWLGTSKDKITKIEIALNNQKHNRVTIVELKDKKEVGKISTEVLTNKKLTLTARETPKIILLGAD